MLSLLIADRIVSLQVNFIILNALLSSGGIVDIFKSFFDPGWYRFL